MAIKNKDGQTIKKIVLASGRSLNKIVAGSDGHVLWTNDCNVTLTVGTGIAFIDYTYVGDSSATARIRTTQTIKVPFGSQLIVTPACEQGYTLSPTTYSGWNTSGDSYWKIIEGDVQFAPTTAKKGAYINKTADDNSSITFKRSGSVITPGQTPIYLGDVISFETTFSTGYELNEVTINGVKTTGNSFTFDGNPNGVNVNVSSKIKTYSVTFNITTQGPTVVDGQWWSYSSDSGRQTTLVIPNVSHFSSLSKKDFDEDTKEITITDKFGTVINKIYFSYLDKPEYDENIVIDLPNQITGNTTITASVIRSTESRNLQFSFNDGIKTIYYVIGTGVQQSITKADTIPVEIGQTVTCWADAKEGWNTPDFNKDNKKQIVIGLQTSYFAPITQRTTFDINLTNDGTAYWLDADTSVETRVTKLTVHYGDLLQTEGTNKLKWICVDRGNEVRGTYYVQAPSKAGNAPEYSISTVISPVKQTQNIKGSVTYKANSYPLYIRLGANVGKVYYSSNDGASGTWLSTDTNIDLNVTYGTKLAFYAEAKTGYHMEAGSPTQANPAKVTMDAKAYTYTSNNAYIDTFTITFLDTQCDTCYWVPGDASTFIPRQAFTKQADYGDKLVVTNITNGRSVSCYNSTQTGSPKWVMVIQGGETTKYSYQWNSISSPITVTANQTINLFKQRDVIGYTLTFTSNDGKVSSTTYKINSNSAQTITWSSSVKTKGVVVNYGDVVTYYSVGTTEWVPIRDSASNVETVNVKGNATIAPAVYRKPTKLTLQAVDYGSWTPEASSSSSNIITVNCEYGDTYNLSGNTLTVNRWDSGIRGRYYFSKPSDTPQYTYTTTFSNTSGTIINNSAELIATTTRKVNGYSVTFNGSYGSWSKASLSIPYGTTYTISGNEVTFSDGQKNTFTRNSDDDHYWYSLRGITTAGADTSAGAETIIGSATFTAQVDRNITSHKVTFNSTHGSWTYSSLNIPYGTTWSTSGQTVTFSNGRTNTFTSNATSDQYTYSFNSISATTGTVLKETSISGTANQSERSYRITLEAFNGFWSPTYLDVPYSSTISVRDQTITAGGKTAKFTVKATTAEATYAFDRIEATSQIVGTGKTVKGYAVPTTRTYTITLGSSYGSWNKTDFTVPYGTTFTVSNNVVTFSTGDTAAFTKLTDTYQYYYVFNGLNVTGSADSSGSGYGVHGDVTITPSVTREDRYYRMSFNTTYGSWTSSSLSVKHDVTWSTNGQTVTFSDGQKNTFTKYPDDSQYTYKFESISPTTGTVKAASTITGTSSRLTNSYTVTLASGYGSWNKTNFSVPFGTTFTVNGATINFSNGTSATFTKSSDTYQYSYTFNSLNVTGSWDTSGGAGYLTGNITVTPSVTRKDLSYTINFSSTYGTWNKSSVSVKHDVTWSVSGTTVNFSDGQSATFTKYANDSEYTYAFSSIGPASGTVKSASTIQGTATRTRNGYTISFNGSYGSWSNASMTIPYGTTFTISNNVVNFSDGQSNTFTTNGTSTQYSYTFNGISPSGTDSTGGVGVIHRAATFTASVTRKTRSYTVTFNATNGSWSSTSVSVPYGTTWSVSGTKVTFSNSTSSTFNINSATDQYNYSFSSISPSRGTVTGNTSISGSATRSEKNYSLFFNASNGFWDRSSTSKPYSSGIYLNGQTVTINGEANTFHCYKSDANYDYVFSSIKGASGTVGKGKTIYGYATAKPKSKTITLDKGNGTWDNANPITVSYGDLIYIKGNNSFAVNGQSRSYSPDWHYYAAGLNVSGDCEYDTTGGYQVYRVKGNVTITPRCYWDDSSNW